MNREYVDVVVAGGGPVGLLMAIELTLGGAKAVVLERLAKPSTVIKAGSLGTLASEALERRGMAAAIAAEEASSREAVAAFARETGADLRGQSSRFAGHFAGLFLIRQDVQKEPERRTRAVRQQGLEEMLAARVRSLGIEVRRGCGIVNVSQDADGVTVAWESANGTGELCCPYLVACDGGRSPIRKMFGFDFPGTAPTLTGHQAIVDVDHPARLLPLGWQRTQTGVFAYGPQPGRLYLLEFDGPPKDRDAPITRDEIEEALRRVSGADVRVKGVTSATRWTDNCRLAATYRKERVLLAGDAAHIHSPFGGQGLNLGLVDAANLGWKLSSIVRGEMLDDLLDTYTAERHPIAEGVLSNTRAQVAIMKPDPQAGAMRAIVADMMKLDDVNRMFGEMMSGLNTRYDLGGGQDAVGCLVGNSVFETAQGKTSLYDLMQDGQGLLVDASSNARASAIAGAVTNRVRCIATKGQTSTLIRPDACVAWVGEGDDTGGLEGALTRWFGRSQRTMPHTSRQAA